jgi:hypothetical protein
LTNRIGPDLSGMIPLDLELANCHLSQAED